MPLAKLESTLCHSGHAGARGKSFRHSVDEPFTLGFMKPPAAFVLIVLIVLLFVLVRSTRVVPPGHVGVVDLFGKVRNEALPSGLHLVNPLARVHRMSVQTSEVKEMDTPLQVRV